MAAASEVTLRRWKAIADFAPAPGAMWELPLKRNDEVATLPASSGRAPTGWLLVRHLTSGLQGIVP